MNALAEEFDGRARFVLVETERDDGLLDRFDAGSFPAYLVFRDGEEVSRLTLNFASIFLEERLRGMLQEAIADAGR